MDTGVSWCVSILFCIKSNSFGSVVPEELISSQKPSEYRKVVFIFYFLSAGYHHSFLSVWAQKWLDTLNAHKLFRIYIKFMYLGICIYIYKLKLNKIFRQMFNTYNFETVRKFDRWHQSRKYTRKHCFDDFF